MRRSIAVVATLTVAFALLGFSRAVLLTNTLAPAGHLNSQRPAVPSRQVIRKIHPDDIPYTASAGYTIAVPALSVGDGRQTRLQIQNTGSAPTSARIEFFSVTEDGCPASPEPAAVRCIGPIPAGAIRSFEISASPALSEARSAIVHSVEPNGATCGGGTGEPLAVVAQRTQTDTSGPEPQIAHSTYVGIAPAVAGFWDTEQEAYITVIPWVEISGTNQTVLHIQNIGPACASDTELELVSGPGCVPFPRPLPTIRPGQSLRVDLASIYDGAFTGSAWIRSAQPLAVVIERRLAGGTTLSSHATGRTASHRFIDAPLALALANEDGWHTAVRTQNTSSRFAARLGVRYRTTEVTPTVKSETAICPGSSTAINTAAAEELTLPFTGTVALLSLSTDPDLPEIPALAAEVDLAGTGGGAAYHAPNRITDTPSAPDIVLPWLTRAYRPPAATLNLTYTSQIAVVNQSDVAGGFISLSFYNPDGSITTHQPEDSLGPRAMRLLDLADVAALPAGWHGSAILQFLSTDPSAGVGVAVLETASRSLSGDTTSAYAGIVARVQAQPTPTPTPTPTATPTATATPRPAATPSPTLPAPPPDLYLPLLRR